MLRFVLEFINKEFKVVTIILINCCMKLACQSTACKVFLEGEVGKLEPEAVLLEHAGLCKFARLGSRSLLYRQLGDSQFTTPLHLQRDLFQLREENLAIGLELIGKVICPESVNAGQAAASYLGQAIVADVPHGQQNPQVDWDACKLLQVYHLVEHRQKAIQHILWRLFAL